MIPTFSTLSNFVFFTRKRKNTPRHRSFIYVPALLMILFFIVSCQSTTPKILSAAQNDSALGLITLPQPLPISKAEAEYFRSACEHWYDSALMYKGFNGGMLVAKNGNIVFEKYSGTAHLPGNDLIDDELSKYIKNFNYPGVTIRSLLNHRSGLPNYLYFMEDLGWDKNKIATNEDVLDNLVNRKAELTNIASPNRHFTYCNTNYALLALLVERVTGIKFPA